MSKCHAHLKITKSPLTSQPSPKASNLSSVFKLSNRKLLISNLRTVALSALQHYLYCPRQCALIHVEQVWAENRLTAEGNILHEKADSGKGESRPGVRISRSLPVWSDRHGLRGICDVVEIHDDGTVIPVEYKRGRPKAHRADEVQICAQAICLEESFERPPGSIHSGFLFYGKQQRRTEVVFDPELRDLTLHVAGQIREMLDCGKTPAAEYSPKLCDRCSMIELCQPKSMRLKRGASSWFAKQVQS